MDTLDLRSISPEASNDSGISSNFSVPLNMESVEEEIFTENEEENQSFIRKEEQEQQQQFEIGAEERFKNLVALLEKTSVYAELMFPRLQKEKEAELKRLAKLEKQEAKEADETVRRSHRNAKKKNDTVYVYEKEIKKLNSIRKRSATSDAYSRNEDVSKKGKFDDNIDEKSPDVVACDLRYFTGGTLRDYQLEGLLWLKARFEQGINGILADEMGLGKTIQVIALFAHFYAKNMSGPFLVVAPLSTLPNWFNEFKRFSPEIPVILYHGVKSSRTKMISKIYDGVKLNGVVVRPVVITSYQMILYDRKLLSKLEWRYLVIDEGHRIKNNDCLLKRELNLLKTSNRLLLTGTPLQNNLAELWSLLNFLLPNLFCNLKWFQSMFDFNAVHDDDGASKIVAQEKEQHILTKLHQIITPFLLRRVKSDVEIELPPKKEIWVYAPLSPLQVEFYKAAVEKCILVYFNKEPICEAQVEVKGKRRSSLRPETLLQEKVEQKTPTKYAELHVKTLRSVMVTLREICIHPYLIEYPLTSDGDYKVDRDIIRHSGKFAVFDRLLMGLLKGKHKILVFSQFCKALDVLQDWLYFRSVNFCRLDGSMSLESRQEEMQRFNEDPDYPVFLISTKAGGLGLNLVAADTVIIFDSDWNPQGDLQAQDRCHRIGQIKPVIVYRLICRGTIDEQIVKRATAKRRLEKMIIHKGNFKFNGQNEEKITPEELLKLLNSCDYSKCLDTDLNNEKVISDKDLKALLDRSEFTTDRKDQQQQQQQQRQQKNEQTGASGAFDVVSVDVNEEFVL